jgi:restriction system protein
MEAQETAELMEQKAHSEKSQTRSALTISILAMVLAIASLGGSNAMKEATQENILAANAYAFYQAKNIRQTEYKIAADNIQLQLAQDKLTPKAKELAEKDYSPEDLIEQGFDTIKANVKLALLERLKVIDPFYFEKDILVLLKKMGYGEFVETKKTGDGGIDGIINQDQLGINKIYIQAKRYSENKVREKDIRNFIGAMSGDTTNGVFVTTSSFDEGAVDKAKQAHHKIILIDGHRLTDLMFQYGVGVQTITTYDLKKVDEDFFEDAQ